MCARAEAPYRVTTVRALWPKRWARATAKLHKQHGIGQSNGQRMGGARERHSWVGEDRRPPARHSAPHPHNPRWARADRRLNGLAASPALGGRGTAPCHGRKPSAGRSGRTRRAPPNPRLGSRPPTKRGPNNAQSTARRPAANATHGSRHRRPPLCGNGPASGWRSCTDGCDPPRPAPASCGCSQVAVGLCYGAAAAPPWRQCQVAHAGADVAGMTTRPADTNHGARASSRPVGRSPGRRARLARSHRLAARRGARRASASASS